MSETEIIASQPWCRLAVCLNIHMKRALLGVLHNVIKDPTIQALPSDPRKLFTFMVMNRNKLEQSLRRRHIKQDQYDILLPHDKMVHSDALDITLIRYLIRTFNGINNADGTWDEPKTNDQSIAAAVYRGVRVRNDICHFNDITNLGNNTFEDIWSNIETILSDLSYTADIEKIKTELFDRDDVSKTKQAFHSNMAEDFEDILQKYKEKCKHIQMKDFVERQYRLKTSNQLYSSLQSITHNLDSIMVSGEAGLGKTFSAKHLRYSWAVDDIFKGKKLLYIDSKRVIKEMYKPSHAAPIYVSELRDVLNNQTNEYLASFGIVRNKIKDLIVVIDGVDELYIGDYLNKEYLDQLITKIDNNEEISGMETIVGIYFGFFFPSSKIILFGRKHEMDRLKDVQNQVHGSNLFDKSKRAELELQPLGENDIKELISRVSCNLTNCECVDCTHIYQKVQDVEFRNIPSHLVSFIKVFKSLPDKNIGRMTKSKLFICTLFNLLKNHSQTVVRDVKTFKNLLFEISRKYTESIQNIAHMSFLSLLNGDVTIQVEEFNENNIIYLKFEQTIRGVNHCIKIEREIMEKVDLFYIRDNVYYFILEPYHLTNMEFLTACYIFGHKDEWELLLEIKNKDRLLVILSYLAGLFADDYFTRDFSTNIFSNSNYSIDQFFTWLYNIEDIRNSLPNGGDGYKCWYGLTDNHGLTPPFYLLDAIQREIEIPEVFNPTKTIVCYCDSSYFEWYEMKFFLHYILTKQNNSKQFNKIQTFLNKFNDYKFMIKGDMEINNKYEMELLNRFLYNDKITFKINLHITKPLTTIINKEIRLNTLRIDTSDSCTLDILLSALSPPTTTSTRTPPVPTTNTPNFNVKELEIHSDIHKYNARQTKKLFEVGLCNVDTITLFATFFTSKQLSILSAVESKCANKDNQINFRLYSSLLLDDNPLFALPSLGTRHISLCVNKVNDKDLKQLNKQITLHKQFSYSNFYKYKIISYREPFIRKNRSMTARSFYLHLHRVNFTHVSPNVFASTLSVVPSLECMDEDRYIPSSHWKELSRTEDTHINELRIWDPSLDNLEHFIAIKSKTLQLIYKSKDKLKEVLLHIANSKDVALDKVMKVFVVKCDENDWDYYDEIVVFSGETIGEFKNNYTANIFHLNKSGTIPYYDGERHLKNWCCEIRCLEELTFSENNEEFEFSESYEEILASELYSIDQINKHLNFDLTKDTSEEIEFSESYEEILVSEL